MNGFWLSGLIGRGERPWRLVCAVALVLLSAALVGRRPEVAAQSGVLLAVDLSADYDIITFGRRLDLVLRYRTGDPLTETCSDVDPQDVVLTLALPAETTFEAESSGSGVFDPATRTVTWQLGALDRLIHCFGGSLLRVTITVDQTVPDGTSLTATADIATSTPGDEPADNTPSLAFQAGMQPLDVVFAGASASCQAGGESDARDDGQTLICADTNSGTTPYGNSATSSAFLTATGAPPPRSLGQLATSPGIWIDAPLLALNGFARSGYDSYGSAGCSPNSAGYPGDAYIEDSVPSVDCGYADDHHAASILHLDCDGTTNSCRRVIHTPSGITEDGIFSEIARVPAS